MPRNHWYIDWFNSSYYYHLYSDRNEKEAANFLQHLIQLLNPAPGSRMLDIACGRGRYSKTLASMGFDVTGTDISSPAIAHAKQFEKENLQFFATIFGIICTACIVLMVLIPNYPKSIPIEYVAIPATIFGIYFLLVLGYICQRNCCC